MSVKSVGAFDAKTHLNELLRRTSAGETIQITRRGIPVARLTPPTDSSRKKDAGSSKNDLEALVQAIRRLRKGTTLGKITVREMIDEGRRY